MTNQEAAKILSVHICHIEQVNNSLYATDASASETKVENAYGPLLKALRLALVCMGKPPVKVAHPSKLEAMISHANLMLRDHEDSISHLRTITIINSISCLILAILAIVRIIW